MLHDSIRLTFVAALQHMGELHTGGGVSADDLGDAERALLARYLQTFEAYDIQARATEGCAASRSSPSRSGERW